jgi:hypothetical protein
MIPSRKNKCPLMFRPHHEATIDRQATIKADAQEGGDDA